MLEFFVGILVAVVFLPDLLFGSLLAGLWIAEKLLIGSCRGLLALLALRQLWSVLRPSLGAANDTAASLRTPRRRSPPAY